MKIEIKKNRRISSIKNEFGSEYPYLKIEFFNAKHKAGEPSALHRMADDHDTLGSLSPELSEGFMQIFPEDTVTYLEHSFQNKFGLSVQVFRKQKSVWIETTKTDHLSLFEQNEKGKSITNPFPKAFEEPEYLDKDIV